MELFDGDYEKIKEVDKNIAQKMGFEHVFLFQDRHIHVNWIHVY